MAGQDVATEPKSKEALVQETKREVLNPFKNPDRWLDYANELTRGYMEVELDGYHLLGDHHQEWLEFFTNASAYGTDPEIGDVLEAFADGRDFVLMCHRDGLKTTITIAVLTACLEYLDGFRAHWIANNQEQAFKKADSELSDYIERNPWLTNLNNTVEDSKKAKTFANGSKLYAGWLFGGIEGDRSHLLILDDVIKEHGDGKTEKVLDWIEGVTVPMVKDVGRSAIIGTRKRPDDIYSHFRAQEGYAVREYPAVLDVWDAEFGEDVDWTDRRPNEALYTEVDDPWTPGETMKVLWPEARGPEWLADKRTKMSDHRFWREYCLVIQGASGNLIDEADVNRLVDDGGCSLRGRAPPREYRAKGNEIVVVAHDPAQSKTGDKAAFIAYLVRADGRRVLLDSHAEVGMKPSAIRAKLADLETRYDPGLVVIEANGMQQYVANDAIEMSATMRGKVRPMQMTAQKHSWKNGIPRLQTLIESGSILFYRGDADTEEFLQAAMSLELKDGRLSGHTPDLIAAWFMAEKGIQALEAGDGHGAGDDEEQARDQNTGIGVSSL